MSAVREEEEDEIPPGKWRDDLPTYKLKDIKEHNCMEKGVWVVFNEGVYDVTEFVENHPGGDTILLAAGADLAPYWKLYSQHHTQQVYDMLEEYRIGNLDPVDVLSLRKSGEKVKDLYANDPERHPALIVRQQKPFNAETPPSLAVKSQITPQSVFFVRNHMPVPDIDAKQYKLTLEVDLGASLDKDTRIKQVRTLSLDDLKSQFKHMQVEAAVQCSGNRRDDFNKVKEVKGLNWALTAISNGVWSGVSLREVLLSFGMSEEELRNKFKHVQFEGYDASGEGTCYGASIPLHTALGVDNDVILAWQLNGEDLSRDHGYPVRVVVPGTVGARSVKWLKSVRLSEEESQSHWQQKDYRMFHSSTDWNNVDWTKSKSVQECPVQCAICVPSPDSFTLKKGAELDLKGYAYSGGGKGVVRVDISLDGGETWHMADLEDATQDPPKEFGWRLWTFSASDDLVKKSAKGQKVLKVVAKATDSSHNVMPKDAMDVWNIRGIMNNSWHRVDIKLE